MNIQQLEYIVKVGKLKSLSKASEKLYVTQSALSQSITQLESELGVKIFERNRTGAVPTKTGKNIIDKATDILNMLQELKAEAAENLIHGKLRIGTIPGSSMFFPKTLSIYNTYYPNIQVEVIEKSSQEIMDDVKQGKLDIGLIGLTREGKEMHDKKIESEMILWGEMAVAVSRNSPLALKKSITPNEIKQYPLAIYNDDRLWEFIHYISAEFGNVNVLISTNNLDIVRNAVLENLAITIGPDYTVNSDFHVLNESVVSIPICGLEQDHSGMALIYAKSKPLSSYISDFIKQLKSQLNIAENHKLSNFP